MSGMTDMADVFDPEPLPPQAPGENECCGSGCERCVWVVHAEETAHWRQAHADWLARQPPPAAG